MLQFLLQLLAIFLKELLHQDALRGNGRVLWTEQTKEFERLVNSIANDLFLSFIFVMYN